MCEPEITIAIDLLTFYLHDDQSAADIYCFTDHVMRSLQHHQGTIGRGESSKSKQRKPPSDTKVEINHIHIVRHG